MAEPPSADGVTDFVREYALASGDSYCDCGYKKKAQTRGSALQLVEKVRLELGFF